MQPAGCWNIGRDCESALFRAALLCILVCWRRERKEWSSMDHAADKCLLSGVAKPTFAYDSGCFREARSEYSKQYIYIYGEDEKGDTY